MEYFAVPDSPTKTESKPTKKPDRPALRDQIVSFFLDMVKNDEATLWKTPFERAAHASVLVKEHWENYRVKSQSFRHWLHDQTIIRLKRNPHERAVREAIEAIEAITRTAATEEHEVDVRVAWSDGEVFLDLCEDDWKAVRITSDGWEKVSNPPVKFRRSGGMRPLPAPAGGGSIEALRQFVNVGSDRDFKLLSGYVLALLRGRGPFPVLILNGEPGSAKSTTARAIRRCIDPFRPESRALPSSERELTIAGLNSWILSFDNLSGMTQGMSDAICRLVSGGGLGTRKLYTDTDETLIDMCRPVILNGIDSLATTGGRNTDLFDRAIVLDLPSIAPKQRVPEAPFWSEFDDALPGILGAVLDAVSASLRHGDEVALDQLPRMADFVIWVTAAENQLGWETGNFLECYEQNRSDSMVENLEASPIYDPLRKLLDGRGGQWSGTATKLLSLIEAPEDGHPPFGWPANASRLSSQLRRLVPALTLRGIEVRFLRKSDQSRERRIDLRRVDSSGHESDDGSPANQA